MASDTRRRTTTILPVLLAGVAAACGAEPAGPGWGPAATLAPGSAHVPTVALDTARGTALVTWIQDDVAGVADVRLARLSSTGPLGDPVRVNDVPGDAAPHDQAPPRVAVDPGGTVYVAWQTTRAVEGRRFPSSDLRFARSTDGGRTFAPAVTVNRDTAGVPSSHTFHDLAVAPDGTILVSWIDSRRRDRWRAERGGDDGAAGGGGAGAPPSEIRVTRSTDGGRTFGPSTVVDEDPCPCCRTSLAVGDGGAVAVAWRKEYDGDVRDIVSAASRDGGVSFGPPVRAARDGWVMRACPHAGPALARDDHGSLHVAWFTGREGGAGLYYARTTTKGPYAEPTALYVAEGIPPSQVAAAPDGAGHVWLAWEEWSRDVRGFRVARVPASGSVEEIRGRGFRGRHPDLAAAGPRRVLAWLEGESVRARVSGL